MFSSDKVPFDAEECKRFRDRQRSKWNTAVDKIQTVDYVSPEDDGQEYEDSHKDIHLENSVCDPSTTAGHSTPMDDSMQLSDIDEGTCDTCNNCNWPIKECSALGCDILCCEECIRLKTPALTANKMKVDDHRFYCSTCQSKVTSWRESAELLAYPQSLPELMSRKLNLENNTELNIWHIHVCNVLTTMTLLPMSMSPTRIATNTDEELAEYLEKHRYDISVLNTSELVEQRRLLKNQFRQLPGIPVDYKNKATTFSWPNQMDMIPHRYLS